MPVVQTEAPAAEDLDIRRLVLLPLAPHTVRHPVRLLVVAVLLCYPFAVHVAQGASGRKAPKRGKQSTNEIRLIIYYNM